jgi:acetyl-CoA decarbonylase/synthase complex subunit gamma
MPTAMEIYKLLPKKNCGECKFPTCLAFAMQLANQKVALEACPYVSPEAKATLEESGAPPIRMVSFGAAESPLKIGDETQLFRHDKTFYHPTVIGVIADDSEGPEAMKKKLEYAKGASFERVGQMIGIDSVGVRHSTGDTKDFLEAVKTASGMGLPVIIMTEDPKLMAEALSLCSPGKPLLYRATPQNFDEMMAVAKACAFPVVIGGSSSLEDLANLSDRARKAGVTDIVLEPASSSAASMLEAMTVIRRASVKKKFRPLGYPTISVLGDSTDDKIKAILGVMKYSSVVLMSDMPVEFAYPLMTLRQNIFTDPQVPIQVKAGIYSVGEPNDKSPVLFTTNFSLTYFTVRADVEKAKVPAWLLVVDTDGQSVMTAFAAGKLTPESVAKMVETEKLKEKNSRNEIIIPGMVSRMSGKLNELTGMKVVVGPRESSGLPKMLKSLAS